MCSSLQETYFPPIYLLILIPTLVPLFPSHISIDSHSHPGHIVPFHVSINYHSHPSLVLLLIQMLTL